MAANPMSSVAQLRKQAISVLQTIIWLEGYNASILIKAVMELKEYHPDEVKILNSIGGMGAGFFKARGIQPIYELHWLGRST